MSPDSVPDPTRTTAARDPLGINDALGWADIEAERAVARAEKHADGGALTAGLLDSMSTDELADYIAERLRDGSLNDSDDLWHTLRHLADKATEAPDAT